VQSTHEDVAVEALQQMIRNACVNDGSPDSGFETRNVDVLRALLEGPGIEVETYESRPGRSNLVARIAGNKSDAPSMCWLAHTDVVPVNPDGWHHDPFGGEIIDGDVWGRGAIDMLNMTSSMAVAMRRLADSGFRPAGDLIFAAVADEESGGTWGAKFLVGRHGDAIRSDYVITESGGFPLPTPSGIALPVLIAERGLVWPTITVRGTPGHGSLPYGTDNALVKAAEIVRRLAEFRPPVRVTKVWQDFIAGMGMPEPSLGMLTNADSVDGALGLLPPGLAKLAYSSTRTTIAPTGIDGGTKTNVIPDSVKVSFDVRMLPGDSTSDVTTMLRGAIGDLLPDVTIDIVDAVEPTESPMDTPLWESLRRVATTFYDDSHLVPMLMVGGTDNRWMRPNGAIGYGFGLFSRKLSLEDLSTMGHGDNERIDVESIHMITAMWESLAHDFLS
jgi:acetylornithine deacetylase/succinyl-diaminopimelate desuccinylase-like protein